MVRISAAKAKLDMTGNTASIPDKQYKNMECQDMKPGAITEMKAGTGSADIQLITTYSKPLTQINNLQAVLKHLGLKKHSVKADGNSLYHSVAYQAELITKCSTGDELVSRHLRNLVFLTMLTHPNVRLETSMSPTEWLRNKNRY